MAEAAVAVAHSHSTAQCAGHDRISLRITFNFVFLNIYAADVPRINKHAAEYDCTHSCALQRLYHVSIRCQLANAQARDWSALDASKTNLASSLMLWITTLTCVYVFHVSAKMGHTTMSCFSFIPMREQHSYEHILVHSPVECVSRVFYAHENSCKHTESRRSAQTFAFVFPFISNGGNCIFNDSHFPTIAERNPPFFPFSHSMTHIIIIHVRLYARGKNAPINHFQITIFALIHISSLLSFLIRHGS